MRQRGHVVVLDQPQRGLDDLVAGNRPLSRGLGQLGSHRCEREVVAGQPVAADLLVARPLRRRWRRRRSDRATPGVTLIRSACGAQRREVEAEDLGSGLADHAPGLVDRDVVEGLLQPLPRVRPGALRDAGSRCPTACCRRRSRSACRSRGAWCSTTPMKQLRSKYSLGGMRDRRATRRASPRPSGRGTAGPRTTAGRAATSSRPR